MTTYVGNAFSIGMVRYEDLPRVRIAPSDAPPKEAVSVVGHQDTAKVLGVAFNRVSTTLEVGDVLYVAQLQGGRLPEGVTTLPEGYAFKWAVVTLI